MKKYNSKEYHKEYNKKNRAKLNSNLAKWSKENKDSIRDYTLKRRYKITREDYNKMFEEQEGCCYLCKRHQSEFKKALHLDHCHETGTIRKLLCVYCNNALGLLDDNIERLEKAIEYLKMFKK